MKSEKSKQSSRYLRFFDFEGIHTQVTRRVRHATRRPVHLAIGLRVRVAEERRQHQATSEGVMDLVLIYVEDHQEASPRTYLGLPFQEPMKILWR